MLQDVRYAFRLLLRSPAFTAAAVLTLALGMGGTTAVFSLVDAVLLHPLPIAHPDNVFMLQTRRPNGVQAGYLFSDYRRMRQEVAGSAELAFEGPGTVLLQSDGSLLTANVKFVSPNYFDVLQWAPVIGRGFTPEDDGVGAAPVVVLTDQLWRSGFAADRGIIGRGIRISGITATVIGVSPPRVRGTDVQSPADLFAPAHVILHTTTMPGRPGNYYFQTGEVGYSPGWNLRVVGRNPDSARAPEMLARLSCASCTGIEALPIMSAAVASTLRSDVSTFTTLLFAAMGTVLLIGCANLAGLVLARGEGRRRDFAVRLAIGAGRARLARQLLIESALISIAGAATGLLVARWILIGFTGFALPGAIALSKLEYPLSGRVLLFAIGVATFTSLSFGMAPARAAMRIDVIDALRHRSSVTHGGSRLRFVLLAGQIALTLMLTAGAALFVRSVQAGLSVDVGLQTDRVLIGDADLRLARYDPPRTTAFYESVVARARLQPGVRSVSFGNGPFFVGGFSSPSLDVDGAPLRLPRNVWIFQGGPAYFSTLGIQLVSGRDIADTDREGAASVVVVNAALARRLWPGQEAIGRRLSVSPMVRDATVVGVAEDGKYSRLTEPEGFAVFAPWLQTAQFAGSGALIVRAEADARTLIPSVRSAIVSMDPNVPIVSVRTLRQRIARQLMPQQFGGWLLGGFSVLALMLAVAGTYGLVSYLVAERTHEIGIRFALGASRGRILSGMLSGSLAAVLAGIAAGGLGVWWTARYLNRFLFGVTSFDPIALAAAVSILIGAALVASYLPARRATRVDPMVALRSE
jgi:putative ABC transport system permease protein